MEIELGLLRGIEKEKAIPFDELVAIIEQAILTAYGKHVSSEGAAPEGVRVELDRKSGHVAVLQPVTDDEGAVVGEEETTPKTSGASRRSRRSRSSASVCATSPTTRCWESSAAKKAISSPVSSSRVRTRG